MKVNNKTVGIIVNPNSGKDIRRLVSSAFVVPQQYKSNELIKLYEGLSSQGVNKVFIMPDFSDVSKRAREKYSNLVDTEILKTRNLDDESTTIESVKQMNNLGLDCIIIFGGDGTARLVANYINHTPILAISTGTNNLFPENIDGTIAWIAVGKFINSENRKNYLWIFSGEQKLEAQIKNSKLVPSNRFDTGVGIVLKNKYAKYIKLIN